MSTPATELEGELPRGVPLRVILCAEEGCPRKLLPPEGEKTITAENACAAGWRGAAFWRCGEHSKQ